MEVATNDPVTLFSTVEVENYNQYRWIAQSTFL